MARRTKGRKRLKKFGRGLRRVAKGAGKGIRYLKSPAGRKKTRQVMSALHKYGGKHGKHIVRLAKKGAKHAGAISKGLDLAAKGSKYLM